MSFDTTHKNLGKVRSGKKYEIKYTYDEEVASIGGISLSCGCSSAHHYPVSKEIVIDYKPQAVPQHMRGQGYYKSQNHAIVNVVDKDGNSYPFSLSFEAIVY
jgi:hypothetical protein